MATAHAKAPIPISKNMTFMNSMASPPSPTPFYGRTFCPPMCPKNLQQLVQSVCAKKLPFWSFLAALLPPRRLAVVHLVVVRWHEPQQGVQREPLKPQRQTNRPDNRSCYFHKSDRASHGRLPFSFLPPKGLGYPAALRNSAMQERSQ